VVFCSGMRLLLLRRLDWNSGFWAAPEHRFLSVWCENCRSGLLQLALPG
jgi:hypothetical protein